ncbi:hypothetical protein [Nodularia sphaerocarpa]|uniref:hypothetical protein n=1 Tax=Nodularia sphaerocarpa TaxID=137816 RepID=UPI001EFC144A|nr:hypothetical protein [Nodularia sphaerocarpa]MDB9374378.1 hypothetical protein [Nodularia sphaerocarpa CS-585]MDB9377909.1 hypothetical protein [Nodularia sphaerocarpa CS-585A2]ULP72333.1 hypothetical protein BDGGKGIB_01972 [Nodularia sphaerocarpa UHCC 0038]
MARIEIDDLYPSYPSNAQQLLNQITEAEMKTVEGCEGNTVTTISDINEQSLANTLDQNLDNLLFQLRNQMGSATVATRSFFNESLSSF